MIQKAKGLFNGLTQLKASLLSYYSWFQNYAESDLKVFVLDKHVA